MWTAEAAQVGERGVAPSHGAIRQRVHTDTRSLQAGDLFVALKGERFDAHDFLPQAAGRRGRGGRAGRAWLPERP